jgi:hypothetical protein
VFDRQPRSEAKGSLARDGPPIDDQRVGLRHAELHGDTQAAHHA